MIQRRYEQLLLRPGDVPPSRDDFEVIGTFNPGAALVDGAVILLVRVVERPRERRAGFVGLPRWNLEMGLEVDWFRDNEIDQVDPRVVRRRDTGLLRLTYTSYLRVVRCGDGRALQAVGEEMFLPETDLEEFGVEDPRLTCIDHRYYFTYVAVSRHGVATALASTADFRTFVRHGIIFCPENKDVVLFPEKFEGDHICLHRPVSATTFNRPEIWLARSSDLVHWGRHEHLLGGSAAWESRRVGPGTPPLRTREGWLVFYHGTEPGPKPGDVGRYAAGALLLDHEQPARILHRSAGPLLEPTRDYETRGFVPDVVFPTGVVEQADQLLVYYGAADTCTAVVEFRTEDVLAAVVEGGKQ